MSTDLNRENMFLRSLASHTISAALSRHRAVGAILLLGALLLAAPPAWSSGDGDEGGGGPGTEDAGQNFFRDDYAIDVDPASGAFSTTIEIDVPEFRGLEPNLDLSYSSSGANGFVGVGWTLGGFSYIDRASAGRGTPAYDSSDIYLLDGQELIACTAMGGTHCTRIQNFQRIVKTSSPDGWVITAPDGTKTTYAPLLNVTGPTTTFRYAIDKVEDRNGNELDYQYTSSCATGPGDCFPTRIEYRDSTGAIGIQIDFGNIDRPGTTDDDVTFATGRDLRTINRLLDDIEVRIGGQLRHRYRMIYGTSSNGGRSLLTRVERRGSDDSSGGRLPDIIIGYEDGTAGTFNRGLHTASSWQASGEMLSGDYDADGMTDLLYIAQTTSPSGAMRVLLSDGDGTFTAAPNTTYSSYPATTQGHFFGGDVDGDGCSDFAHAATNGEVYLWYSDCDGTFTRDDTNTSGATVPTQKHEGRWFSGDFNGDGKLDMAHAATQTQRLYIWQSGQFADRWQFQVSEINPAVSNVNEGWWLPVDLNGDARTDIVHLHQEKIHTYVSNGDFTFDHTSFNRPGSYPQAIQGGKWRAGDFNGDGKTDLFHIGSTNGMLHVWYSLGHDDFSFAQVTVPAQYPATLGGWWFPIELNGDGRTDLYHIPFEATGNGSLRLWMSRGAPGEFSNTTIPNGAFPPTGEPALYGGLWQSGDLNGDGRDDLFHLIVDTRIRTWTSTGQVDNRLNSFQNRTGGTTSVTYQASSEWSNGYLPVGMVMHTVDTITTNDGRGNTHPISYMFEDGLWSSRERCFLGFRRSLQVLDANNNYLETITRQAGNCTRRPEEVYQRHSNDAILDPGDGIFSYSLIFYDEEVTTPPYFALEKERKTYECELTSNLGNCREIRSETFRDQYANVTRLVEHGDTAVGTDQRTTIRDFSYNTTDFLVGLVGRETLYDDVTVNGSGANLVSRSEFVYDNQPAYTSQPTKGNLTNRFDWEDWTGDALPGVFRETQFGYDTYGNLTSEIDPNLNTTSTVFDTTHKLFPEDICTPLIPCRTQQWDFRLGVIDIEWDTNSAPTDHSYDTHGRLRSSLHPDGTLTEFEYFSEGIPTTQRVRIREPDHTSGGSDPDRGLWRDVYIDGLGRTWNVIRESGAQQLTTYHENSERVASRSLWFRAPEIARYRVFEYDGAKRLERVTEPSTAQHSLTYGIGFVTRTDTLNKQRTNFTDAYGRIVQVDELVTTPTPATYTTLFDYDDLGNLIQVTDHQSNPATFSYDTLSQKRRACDFNLGCWDFGYDPGGRMTSQTDAKSQATAMTYDALDRLKTKLNAEGKLTTWFYDEDPGVHGDSNGRLTRIAYAEGSESFRWNNMGLQEAVTRCVGFDCRQVQQTFEAARLKTLTYPDGEVVVYSYDLDGHLFSVLGTDGAQSSDDYVTSMTYNARDQLETMVFANGVTTTLQYANPYDALSDFNAVDDTLGTVFEAHYVYNDATQITSITSPTHPQLAVTLGYDDLYRLTSVSGGQSQTFTYTPIGNILTNSAISGTYQYGDTSKPHAVTQAGSLQYGYDANGNLTSVTNRTSDCISVARLMRWDSENQLTWLSNGTETVSYQYNANGSRIRRSGPSVGTTHYFGKIAEVEDPGGTPVLTKFYYAGDFLVAREEGGTKTFYHQDHLDSVRALSDANGAQIVRYEYAAFGEEIAKVGTAENAHSFGAHRRDSESGLLYMGARYHDPVVGRFTQPDQVVPEAGDPQSWNRYSFVRNNPFNRIDPTGRVDIVAADIADRFDQLAAQASDILSDAVLNNGGFLGVVGATAVQTAIDVGSATVDTLRLGEGAAEGGLGIVQDVGRAFGIAGGSGAALSKATSIAGATTRATKAGTDVLKTTRSGLRPTKASVRKKIDRGIRSADELDAVKDPLKVTEVKLDELGRPSQRFIGRKAEVVVNPETGQIPSVNPTSTKKAQRLLRQSEELE